MSKNNSKKKTDTSAAVPRGTAVNGGNENDFDLVSWLCETAETGNESAQEAPPTPSSEAEDIPAGDDIATAYRVLENTILFDAEFIEEQKKKLDNIRTSSATSSNFHEMPEENLKVAVVGSFSCGKSTFINSILDDDVAPSEITPMTHGITSFIYGEKELYTADDAIISREEYQAKVQDKEETVKHFIIEYPCPQLKEFEFMDSPGFASVSSNDNKTATEDTELSEEAVQRADVVFFLNNITEGTISGDAMERLKAISRNDAAENPHRRIFVVLTWADRKPPKARETIRANIINLCEDNKLAVDGVMLYSSLIDKAMKSDRPFFEDAKKHLFDTLVKLRAEGQEIKKFRIELKQQAASHTRKKTLSQFVKVCNLYLGHQKNILPMQAEKQFEKDWSSFLERCVGEIADVTYGKVIRMFENNEDENVVSIAKLSNHWLCDYYIKFDYKKLFLTNKESEEIKNIILSNKGNKLVFPEDDPSFIRFFNPPTLGYTATINGIEYMLAGTDNDDSPDYRTLQADICKEAVLLMYPSEKSYPTDEDAQKAAIAFCSDILKSFKQKSVELWEDYLTAILKASIRDATLSPYFDEVSAQANNVQELLDGLSSSEGDAFSVLGLSDF